VLAFEEIRLTRRNGAGEVPVLRGVSCVVPDGRVTAVLGPSGSGKSTLLRLACRLEDPDAGRILLDGVDTTALDVLALRRRVGFLSQEPVLFGSSVRANLAFAVDPNGTPREPADPGALLERVGLDAALLDREPGTLSVGQRQRVAFARALVPGPQVLLLDEPTSALDPRAATGILRLVRELRDDLGLAVLLVTHVVDHAREVADRVAVLMEGRIAAEGGPELFEEGGSEATRAFLAGEEP